MDIPLLIKIFSALCSLSADNMWDSISSFKKKSPHNLVYVTLWYFSAQWPAQKMEFSTHGFEAKNISEAQFQGLVPSCWRAGQRWHHCSHLPLFLLRHAQPSGGVRATSVPHTRLCPTASLTTAEVGMYQQDSGLGIWNGRRDLPGGSILSHSQAFLLTGVIWESIIRGIMGTKLCAWDKRGTELSSWEQGREHHIMASRQRRQVCPRLRHPRAHSFIHSLSIHCILTQHYLSWKCRPKGAGQGPHCLGAYILVSEVKVKVAQSCPTICDPMDYTVHGILQARILQ